MIEAKTTTARTAAVDKLRRFLSAYWLRPENAFWMVLRSDALDAVPIRSPSLDLSCGDGIFSFLHAGGRFAPDFDVFGAVANLDRVTDDYADMFDAVDAGYQPKVLAPPSYTFDCGTDCKRSLLDKAVRLNFYKELLHHDSNDPLPFRSEHFETVYCNAAYWIDRIEEFLAELRRITARGGTIILQVKLDQIRHCTLERHRNVLGKRWLDTINRGRFETWPSLCDAETWESRFDDADLETLAAIPFVGRTHAHIWDIGLRPIAPLLVKAMNSVHAHLRREIKRDWVDLFCTLLEPICDPELDLFEGTSETPVEMQYVLTPRPT